MSCKLFNYLLTYTLKMEESVERNYLKQEESFGTEEELIAQEERDRRYLVAFCQRSGTRLVRIDYSSENERNELMYYFDDNLGGYTIGGLIRSLM